MEKITLKHKELIDKYFNKKYTLSDFNFTTLYIWRDYFNYHFEIRDDFLIIYGENDGKRFSFLPINSHMEISKKIIVELLANSYDIISIPEEYLHELNEFFPQEERDKFDYLYDKISLIELSGHKLHSKKNLYNHFCDNYDFVVEIINQNNINDIIKFETNWNSNNTSLTLVAEKNGIIDVLTNFANFNLQGIVIKNRKNNLLGFTLGEEINSETFLIHIEKGDKNFHGIYQGLNCLFLQTIPKEIKFINREEDLGVEGLRKAKLSYHPIRFIKKFKISNEGN